jgi:alpha-beta hydrolase superfamily lysophospholipase
VGPHCRIYLFGRGVGATAALLAAQQKGFCPEVCGIIADSPMDTLPSYLRNVLDRDKFISTEAALYRLRMLTKARFGFDMNVCDCAVHAGRIRVPVLLFEGGEDDETLPRGVSDIYDNLRCRKRMVVINDAKHLQCYENAQALYEREIQKFIESCISRLAKLGRL